MTVKLVHHLGPFTVSSSTQKVDTRARARAIALKVAKHS